MKQSSKLLSVVLGLSMIASGAEAEARGEVKRGGSDGGGKAASSNRSSVSSSSAKRSPMTGSKIERPVAKPAPRPATRPASQPASKPAPKPAARPESRPAPQPAQRPAPKPERPTVERPSTRPAPTPDKNPGNKLPDKRPDNKLPDKRPDNKLPDKRPDNKLPDKRPDNKLPDKRPDNKLPDKRPDNKLPDKRPDNKLPDKRPDNKLPDKRPDNKLPDKRPDNKLPNVRPGGGGEYRPGGNGGGNDNRPTINRPTNNKPATLPGMVTYPSRPGGNNNNRPGDNKRPNWGNGNGNGSGNNINSGNTYIKNVNKDRKNTYLNRPGNRPAGSHDWDNNRWGGNHGVWGNNNNVNIHVDNHFHNNNNYSYRPNYWGARPWWGAGNSYAWHHGHWNYGYNSHYYNSRHYYSDSNFASGFMWGITVWSLGNMVYDMGYQSYRNPYPAPAVVYYPAPSSGGSSGGDSKSSISYDKPLSVTAAATPPGDEAVTTLAETKSADATEKSRTAFKTGDYVSALKSADEAIAYAPGDVTLHEYRALVLFALGRYSDAAGVLNPVLASGPGWGWETMVGFYGSATTYSDQLRKLESYVKGKPDAADARFLLGYHYLVSGHIEDAYGQFDKAATLQPADSISRQLRDLTKSSLPDNGEETTPEATEPPAPPAPVPTEKLVGTWTSDRGEAGKVTFTMAENGDYTWSYINGGDSKLMNGTYGINDKGLLVLSSDDSQMVSSVTLDGDRKMKFLLVGAPDGDPGLDFTKG